jgi:protein-tyrosine-phosphatase
VNEKFVILFVCTGNTCRSPMAEGALRSLLEKQRAEKFDVASAGTMGASGYPATSYAIEAAKIWDADISRHESQPLTKALIERADLIFGMAEEHVTAVLRLSREAKDKTFLFTNFPEGGRFGEGIDDPIGQSLDRYNQTFLEIGEYLGKQLDGIVKLIDAKTDA